MGGRGVAVAAGVVGRARDRAGGRRHGSGAQGHSPILGKALAPGDGTVVVASSGLHANGASLARLLAGRLPDGYATELGDGTTLGEALLEPSVMYVPLVAALLDEDVPLSYISHITGHGLLKLMRPPRALTYRISAAAAGAEGAELHGRAGGSWISTRRTDIPHGLQLCPVCAAGPGRRLWRSRSGWAWAR